MLARTKMAQQTLIYSNMEKPMNTKNKFYITRRYYLLRTCLTVNPLFKFKMPTNFSSTKIT